MTCLVGQIWLGTRGSLSLLTLLIAVAELRAGFKQGSNFNRVLPRDGCAVPFSAAKDRLAGDSPSP